MFFYKSDDDKIKINLLKLFQSFSINYGNHALKIWDNLVKNYGVISNTGSCYLENELKVEQINTNTIKVYKGSAIFPIHPSFFIDLPQDVNREVLIQVSLDNDITLNIGLGIYFVVLTVDRQYFNEVKYEKTYSNPPEVGNMIYELKGKIEIRPFNVLNISTYKNASFYVINGKKYGLILAIVNNSGPPEE
jgi:hypothetical protein